ncbi:hypothetical protein IV203_031480 [Nitzschia inconspicua]|uniref:Uncharacterized protein n=1 Tax=Nitzschia inconspicua TaxID=303405 RepID=A0A9K3LV91_9STRA|nr:hypothetical protein IV203_031480 [Nitzschia inconspicua]
MDTATTESVFDRLSRRQTAASIGQQVEVKGRRTSKGPVNRLKYRQLPTSKMTQPRDLSMMTTDMRLSLLDELEEVEQTWPEHCHDENIQDSEEALLQELLESALLSTSSSAPTQKTIVKNSVDPESGNLRLDNTVEPSKQIDECHQSVFERLYNKETKASVGQQIESVRQKTLLKMQFNSMSQAAAAHKAAQPRSQRMSSTVSTCSCSTDVSKEEMGGIISFNTPNRNRPWNRPTSGDYRTSLRTPEQTPDTIYASLSDDSSASTVSSLIDAEIPVQDREKMEMMSLAAHGSQLNASLDFLLLPKSSTMAHAPWKMALIRKVQEVDGEHIVSPPAEPLYLRSMANVLYDFASGNSTEMEVASELITALFHRDFECAKYWTEEPAQVTTQEAEGVYRVEKAAESSSDCGGTATKTVSSAVILFDHSNRMVIVQDYHHGSVC